MKILLDNFIPVPPGMYSIGLDHLEINKLLNNFKAHQIKKEFLMNSYPHHFVSVESFGICRKLVTFNEYMSFVESTEYVTDAEKEGWGWTWDNGWKKVNDLTWKYPFGSELDAVFREKGELFPVLQISWNDAKSYCDWLSVDSGLNISLPDEYQWEIASDIIYNECKKSDSTDNKLVAIKNIEEYVQVLLKICSSGNAVTPIGIIWEWTYNWFDKYPGGFYNKEFGNTYKVLRGGSLMSNDIQRVKQYRFRRCPTARSPFYGFRLAVNY